jgi:ABC-type nitrate/sulfonate/bicarbonate transport system substrate-binding protein
LNGTGWCPATSETIAPGHPEKVLLTTEDFASQRPDDLNALLRALLDACLFCDHPANRSKLPSLLTSGFHRPEDRELLAHSLVGPFQTGIARLSADRFHIFHREGVNRPSRTQADWLLRGFSRHGIIPQDRIQEAEEAMRACWSPDFYDRALSPRPVKRRRAKPVA